MAGKIQGRPGGRWRPDDRPSDRCAVALLGVCVVVVVTVVLASSRSPGCG
jgi:hypothetical protein